jgi:predicted enzyme related to lactoylglutathione lyase
MLRGLTTVSFYADDVAEAARWYAEVLGIEPYFARSGPEGMPAYVEFRVGDGEDELGIIDRRFEIAPSEKPAGAVVYWHVDNLEATVARLIELGASVHDEIRPRGEGFDTASVIDPFGNVLGVMYNPHWLARAGT